MPTFGFTFYNLKVNWTGKLIGRGCVHKPSKWRSTPRHSEPLRRTWTTTTLDVSSRVTWYHVWHPFKSSKVVSIRVEKVRESNVFRDTEPEITAWNFRRFDGRAGVRIWPLGDRPRRRQNVIKQLFLGMTNIYFFFFFYWYHFMCIVYIGYIVWLLLSMCIKKFAQRDSRKVLFQWNYKIYKKPIY